MVSLNGLRNSGGRSRGAEGKDSPVQDGFWCAVHLHDGGGMHTAVQYSARMDMMLKGWW